MSLKINYLLRSMNVKLLWILMLATAPLCAQPTESETGISKYAAENLADKINPSKGKRVVFMGDSVTELWKKIDSGFFTQNNYLNRGISGETTGQMLARFSDDVISLDPAVVIILGGTNDIAQNNGPVPLEDTYRNIVAMAELAKARKIKVVLCSVLPVKEFSWRPGLDPAAKIIRLNAMLKRYAKTNKMWYVDYHSAMVDKDMGLQKDLSVDGVHPNYNGYTIMKSLIEKAILKALKKEMIRRIFLFFCFQGSPSACSSGHHFACVQLSFLVLPFFCLSLCP